MNHIANWMDAVAALQSTGLKELLPVIYTVEVSDLNREGIGEFLANLPSVTGWVCEPSSVSELNAEKIVLTQLPLSGEFFQKDSDGKALQCWQLSHLGRNRWQVAKHTIQHANADTANGLSESVQHLHASRNAVLEYKKIWQLDESGAPSAKVAVLVDIKEVAHAR